ncbi:alpha/beta hydrolase [Marinobacterium zhoushanense]|uniref:alpha/beta hydrolase n=1 Tax=Marinobacterium zhoushanense TaxID=1679163 RepID=UPI001662DD08|nr:alpha/beta hydrolase [Marinobacterium zhoushanense]
MHLLIRRAIPILSAAVILSGCTALPTPQQRIDNASHIASRQGWVPFSVRTGNLTLSGYAPEKPALNGQLRVYIEGDGLAWISRSRPSPNPTPVNPVALNLALADPGKNAIYLGRPCQYQSRSDCPSRYWLERRFSAEVIQSYEQALDQLKQRYAVESYTLIGFSGGGAIAALLAAKRTDVSFLITVAGNLDTQYWTKHHHISPLEGSLNPRDSVPQLARVKQWHFVGSNDRIIPPSMILQFIDRFPKLSKPTIRVVPGYDHHCCWTDHWPDQLAETEQLDRKPDKKSPRVAGAEGLEP